MEIENILNLLNHSYSPFHVVNNIEKELLKKGFQELAEKEDFRLEKGKSYFVKRNGSSIIAFTLPKGKANSFRITSSHTDSPTFKLKPNPIITYKNLLLLNTEPYGGGIYYSWMDRPLSIAGRLLVEDENGINSKLFAIEENLLTIPSVAIHMNRDINSNASFNPAKDMIPLLGNVEKDFSFSNYLKEKAGLRSEETIIAHDLFLFSREKALLTGLNQEFVSSPRLDDLGSVYTSLFGFMNEKKDNDSVSLFVSFDNEEVGSLTRQGANSTFLSDILKRIASLLGNDYRTMVANSVMLSIDNGHANHPNHPGYSDPTTDVELNKGVVIKYNANQKYTTDAISSALIKGIAAKENLLIQEYTNRSDLKGGSTLGNISNSEVSLLCADIGLPQLAMHSSYELVGKNDMKDMIHLVSSFYETKIIFTQDGFALDK